MLQLGSPAPEFTATLDSGETFRLADLRGKKNVVLYFYPKDETAGCVREACQFRDRYAAFRELDAVIVGASTDSAESHQRFREHHKLPFPLIADTDKRISRLFDARGLFGRPVRVTYIIDKDGVVRGAFQHDVLIGKHVGDTLERLAELQGVPATVSGS